MSNSSFNDYLITVLDNISNQMNRYIAIFIFLFGVIGNILNILVLSQRTLRSNSCAWLFLASSIVNLVSILFGLTTREMHGWALDPTSTTGWACKLRAYIVFTSRTISLWLIMLATIDRWLLSSINVHRRQMSTLKNAQLGTIIVIIFSFLLYAQMLYCYEANLVNTPLECYGKTIICRRVTDLSFALITILFPVLSMISFGLMTIANIHQSKRRLHSLAISNVAPDLNQSTESTSGNPEQRLEKKTDRSLLRMLFIQVILLTLFTLPLSIQKFYSTFAGENQSPSKNAIDAFVYNSAVLIYFISNGMPFYIYTLCGGSVFRKAFYDFVRTIKRKMTC